MLRYILNPDREEQPLTAEQSKRELALTEAVRVASIVTQPGTGDAAIRDLARTVAILTNLFEFTLDRGFATALRITPSAPVDQSTGARSPLITKDGVMQLTDTQQVDLVVEPEDSKGNPTADTLTWGAALNGGDASSAVTLSVSTDTLTCTVIAGSPAVGVVVTATDPNNISGSISVDVVAGTAASLVITPGTPVEQPTPPAP
jgi:hypothetical protein